MKTFVLGQYKGLSLKETTKATVTDTEMDEALRLLTSMLVEGEEHLLSDLLPALQEKIQEEKARLEPYAKMDAIIGLVAEQCQYELDGAELDALANQLCHDFLLELSEKHKMDYQEYFSLRDIDPSVLLDECRIEAARRLVSEAVLAGVIEAEGIELNEVDRQQIQENDGLKTHDVLRAKALVKLLEYNLQKS